MQSCRGHYRSLKNCHGTHKSHEVNAYADAHQRLVQEEQWQVWQEGPRPLQLLQGLSRQLLLQQELLNLACAARPAAAKYDDIRRMQDLKRCHRGTSNTQSRHSACRFYTCYARWSSLSSPNAVYCMAYSCPKMLQQDGTLDKNSTRAPHMIVAPVCRHLMQLESSLLPGACMWPSLS